MLPNEIFKYLNKLVICPRCGKPGILSISRIKVKHKDKVYRYVYLVVRHAETNHIIGNLNEITIDSIKKLKFVEVMSL